MTQLSEEGPLELAGEYFDFHQDENIAVLRLKGTVFEMATNLALKEKFFEKLKLARRQPDIKVLLIIGGTEALGEDKFNQFRDSIMEENRESTLRLIREENALSQFIRLIYNFEKIVICGVNGSVIGPFLGAILAADCRIAAENTQFAFPHIKYGIVPQGALAYFLPRYAGMARARQILLCGEALSARKAFESGLINELVSEKDFENRCLETARKLSELPASAVGLTKRLLMLDSGELEAYMKKEAELAQIHPGL